MGWLTVEMVSLTFAERVSPTFFSQTDVNRSDGQKKRRRKEIHAWMDEEQEGNSGGNDVLVRDLLKS